MRRISFRTSLTRSALIIAMVCSVVVAIGTGPAAASGPLKEFAVPTAKAGLGAITTGPDGKLWFVEAKANKIGCITTLGTIIEYPVPTAASGLQDITAGPDGNLWFTEFDANMIGMITPAGTITEYPMPTMTSGPQDITAGPDGNLWFTESYADQIGQITPSGVVTEYPVPTTWSSPHGITAGPDGNLWFTESAADQIGQITPSGTVTEYASVVPGPEAIASGPDGNLWFMNGSKVARFVISSHAVTSKTLYMAFEMDSGPGSNLCCTAQDGVAVVSTSLAITTAHLRQSVECASVANGPDGRVWFTENPGNAIGRFTLPIRKVSVSATVSFVRRSGSTYVRFAGTAGARLSGTTLHLEWGKWGLIPDPFGGSTYGWWTLISTLGHRAPMTARIGTDGRFSASLLVAKPGAKATGRYRVGHCWVLGMASATGCGWHGFTVH